MFRLNDKSTWQELPITNINRIVSIDIFRKEAFELSNTPRTFVHHLRHPYILPNSHIMALHILQKQPYIHEKIHFVGVFEIHILLSVHNEKFVL